MPAAEAYGAPIGAEEARALLAGLSRFRRIALAVSGGRDSTALLRLVHRWAGEAAARPGIVALTVDHRLRAGSADEADKVAAWCAALGVEHHILVWTGAKPRARIQERAREARYRLMGEWCAANGVDALVVAHHLEDQAETVLMRLARSSGVDGLAAMTAETSRDGLTLVRPLLGVPRARLAATLSALGQDWLDDPSNDDPAYERVRLRDHAGALAALGLVPSAVAGSAARLARAAEALVTIARKAAAETVRVEPAGYALIDRDRLWREPEEIRMRVVALALGAVGGERAISDAALARAVSRIGSETLSGFTLAGCRIAEAAGGVVVVRELRGPPRMPLGPGQSLIWDRRFAVTLARRHPPVEVRALGEAGFAEARARDESLAPVPPMAGAALPGGFDASGLAAVPHLGAVARPHGLAIRFLRPCPGMQDG